jgi:hypothetical protein
MPDPRDDDEHDEHDEHDDRDERELRVLLGRAVPRLPAAEGRMRRVRERVVRTRRRRRAAGGAALTVTGLVLAGALVPGLPGFAGADSEPERAGSRGTGVASPAVSATTPAPSTTPAPGPSPSSLNTVTFTELGGLTLRLPGYWSTLELPADPVHKADPQGFISSRPFGAANANCGQPQGQQCPPMGTLGDGEALLILTPMSAQGLENKVQHPTALENAGRPSGLCRKLLGTTEYVGMMDGQDSPYTTIVATLCVSGAAPEAVTDIGAALAGAGFDITGATPAPHPTPTNK